MFVVSILGFDFCNLVSLKQGLYLYHGWLRAFVEGLRIQPLNEVLKVGCISDKGIKETPFLEAMFRAFECESHELESS